MHWAKTRQAARYNLAVSGVPAVGLRELPIGLEDLEISGASFYGWPPLIEGLSRRLGVAGDRIVHAVGTSMANYLAMAVCVERGDEVLIEEPTYELLVDTARHLGASIRRFPRRRGDAYQPDLGALRTMITTRTRLVVLTNLHNPSSAWVEPGVLGEIAWWVGEAGARLLVDEVYLDALFDRTPRTAALLGEQVLTTSSLTKVYGLSGLRCGWVVASKELAERMWRLNDLFGVIPAHAAERMSVIALERMGALEERSRRTLEANRVRWNAFLRERGDDLEGWPAEFGTVTFPRLRSGDVEGLVERLRTCHETTVVPGRLFGEPDAFRVGLGATEEVFTEGLRRLGLALDEIRRVRAGARG